MTDIKRIIMIPPMEVRWTDRSGIVAVQIFTKWGAKTNSFTLSADKPVFSGTIEAKKITGKFTLMLYPGTPNKLVANEFYVEHFKGVQEYTGLLGTW